MCVPTGVSFGPSLFSQQRGRQDGSSCLDDPSYDVPLEGPVRYQHIDDLGQYPLGEPPTVTETSSAEFST